MVWLELPDYVSRIQLHSSNLSHTKVEVEQPKKVFRQGVGKYIPKAGVKRSHPDTESSSIEKQSTISTTKYVKSQLSDFSAW